MYWKSLTIVDLINIIQLGLLMMGTSLNFIMYIKYVKYKYSDLSTRHKY